MDGLLPTPLSNSYLVALIHRWFPSTNLVDCMNPRNKEPITHGSIVFVCDELLRHARADYLDTLQRYNNLLLISQDVEHFQLLQSHGYAAVYAPFFSVIDDAISVRRLGDISIRDNFTGEYNFLCLNRKRCQYRVKLLHELAQHNLLAKGYVTYHAKGKRAEDLFHHEDLRQDDLTHYTDTLTGFERHNHLINDVWCSSNVRNYIYIGEKFTGHTVLSSETRYFNAPTEKSFIAFFCKKMPMIFSPRPIITMLQNDGFDCFTDIIDQSYDNEDTWDEKIKLGIAANLELLSSNMRHKKAEIDHRTQRNYEHLVTHWLDRRLAMLKHDISSRLRS